MKEFEEFLDGEFVQYEPMQVYKRDQMKYLSRVLQCLSERTLDFSDFDNCHSEMWILLRFDQCHCVS